MKARELRLVEHAASRLDGDVLDLLERWDVGPGVVRHLRREQSLEERPENLFALGEVVVERGSRDARFSSDVLDPHRLVGARREQVEGAVHDRLARRPPPSARHRSTLLDTCPI